MKTCGQCKHRWMECCLKDKRERLTVDAADEACESFELHLGKLDEAFETSLEKACRKHPVFLDAWPKAEDAETYLDTAEIHKLDIGKKESTQLHSILVSEVFEFLAEIARGDFDRALEEAGDVVAVLYRALNGDWKEVRNEVHAD